MQFDIYQIQIPKEVKDYVNSNDRGHLGGEEKYPIYKASMKSMRVQKGDSFDPADFSFYTKVCSIKEDGGLVRGSHDNSADAQDNSYLVQDKEEVFKILNGYYYDEDTEEDIVFDHHVFGYKMKTFERDGKTHEYRDMHSLSVGDIVAEISDEETRYYQVADWGYNEIFPQQSDVAINRIKESA